MNIYNPRDFLYLAIVLLVIATAYGGLYFYYCPCDERDAHRCRNPSVDEVAI